MTQLQREGASAADDGETDGVALEPRRVAIVMAASILVLNALNAAVIIANPWDIPTGTWLTLLVESNPATWYASAQLATAAVLFALLGRGRPDSRSWFVVAAVVLALSIDEVAMFHERFDSVFGTSHIQHFGWAIPGSILVLAVGWFALRWFRQLTSTLRWRLTAAFATYVAGGLIVEVLSGIWQVTMGEDRLWFVIVSIEENLELLGVAIAVLALLDEARRRHVVLGIQFGHH